MSPLIRPLQFGQNQDFWPGRPYAPIVPMATVPNASNPAMATLDNDTFKEANPGNPAKPLRAHDYALAPIKAFKDEHDQRHDLVQQDARQGATMISEMNKHQLGEQLNTNSTIGPRPVNS